ncbi:MULTISPECIES: hypothetical protein [unclassified Clostridium]|uniref:hypothetical protein n=1 Tax=unclassified Clostridium TaxID=2614128 RepID=UPI0007738299|nr:MULTISPECIES: hypothetical protein [unclassified Clostridium]MBN1045259.1 hypothetical protein [Clostridium botulinum]
MIVCDELKEKIVKRIIKICREEVKEKSNKELIGLTVDYFYDGKAIDIGCTVHVFDNNKNIEEGYTKHISFTINSDASDSELLLLLRKYNKDKRFEAIEKVATEIKEYIESINWNCIVNTYEDMFIEIELYD